MLGAAGFERLFSREQDLMHWPVVTREVGDEAGRLAAPG
jgi:hypothetical protein